MAERDRPDVTFRARVERHDGRYALYAAASMWADSGLICSAMPAVASPRCISVFAAVIDGRAAPCGSTLIFRTTAGRADQHVRWRVTYPL